MENRIKRDGHMHTPFCRHGSDDSLEAYVNEAIRLKREEITFTEHFPLPPDIADRAFIEECSLLKEEVPAYIKAIKEIKEKYKGKLKINLGFEVDYVEEKENEIKKVLDEFGPEIEDSILSVHFVLYQGKYYAIDCLDTFEELLEATKSLETVYELYFKTVLKSVQADLGKYKPKRIGHPTLIRIFNQKYPYTYDDKGLFNELLTAVQDHGMELDYNSAGLRKQYCLESYPSGRFLKLAKEKKISLIPGSDAHETGHMAVLDQLAGK